MGNTYNNIIYNHVSKNLFKIFKIGTKSFDSKVLQQSLCSLAHQGAVSEMQAEEQKTPIDMMEQVTRGMDNRVEFYQQSIVTMDMKTNVPEPFKAEDDHENELKEGLPIGLSDSQVNLEARSNMDFRLEHMEHIII